MSDCDFKGFEYKVIMKIKMLSIAPIEMKNLVRAGVQLLLGL
jgi:hypothetical protein